MGDFIFGIIMGFCLGYLIATPSSERFTLAMEFTMNKAIVAGGFELDGRKYKIVPAEVVEKRAAGGE